MVRELHYCSSGGLLPSSFDIQKTLERKILKLSFKASGDAVFQSPSGKEIGWLVPPPYALFPGSIRPCRCAVQDQFSAKNLKRFGNRKPARLNRIAPDSLIAPKYRSSSSVITNTFVGGSVLPQLSADQDGTDSFLKTMQKVKESLQALQSHKSGSEIATVVTQLQRLGVDGYFRKEIEALLENLYRKWKSISSDQDDAATDDDLGYYALTFFLLRRHGYDVTPGPLANFDNNRKLVGTGSIQNDGASRVASIVNLKCATDLMFPGEEGFFTPVRRAAIEYLTGVQENELQIPSHLFSQVKHELDFHWYRKIQIVETLQYLQLYGDGYTDSWTGSSSLRHLAIQSLDLWQVNLIQELEITKKWNIRVRIPELPGVRDVAELLLVAGMSTMPEPQYRYARLALAKNAAISYMIDDLFDDHTSLDTLRTFTESIQRWEPSLPDIVPEEVKIIYNIVWETVNDLAQQASDIQGRDLHKYFRRTYTDFVESQMTEAEWRILKREPSFDECLKVGNVSIAIYTVIELPMFFGGLMVMEHIEHEDYCHAFQILTEISRLGNDVDGYERDKSVWKVNLVSIMMRESDGAIGEAEAIQKMKEMTEQGRTKLIHLLLSSPCIPDHAMEIFLFSLRFSQLSTDTSHPFTKCFQGRPESLPDATKSYSTPILREFNNQLQDIKSHSSNVFID